MTRTLISFAAAVAFCLVAVVALAQGTAVALASVDPAELLGQAIHVVRNAKTIGFLGTIAAVCYVLLRVLRYRVIGAWLDKRGWYARAAGLLGAVAGVCLALSMGQWEHAITAAGAGWLAGLSAVGLDQNLRGGKKAREQAEQAERIEAEVQRRVQEALGAAVVGNATARPELRP